VVDGCNVTPQALDEMQNSLRLMEFVPRGRARLAVSFNFDLRGRAAEVGIIEPEAAELTRENLKKGDVIIKYAGETLIDFEHLTRITRKHEVGDRIALEVRRNGEPLEFEVELTGWKRPESSRAP
jgi:S1-C subfamily serine protease